MHLDHPWLFFGALLVLGVWTFGVYARTRPEIRPNSRRLLSILRLTASLLLALMLGGWSLEWNLTRQEPPRLHVLLDASESMSLPVDAGPDSKTRYEAAFEILEDLEGETGIELLASAFGEGLIEGPPPAKPFASFTDLGAALQASHAAREGEHLLILSDGQDLGGRLWAKEPRRPVIALMLGDSLPGPDLRLGRPEVPAIMQVGEQGLLRVEIQSVQGGARSGRILLREGDILLDEQSWDLGEGPGRLEIELPLILDSLGSHKLTLDLEGQGEDDNPENNRQIFSVEVLDERLEILVFAGRPDWDLPFMLDALRAEENLTIRLVTMGAEGQPKDADTGEIWRPGSERVDGLVVHSLGASWADRLVTLDPGGLFILPGALASANLPADWGLESWPLVASEGEFTLRWSKDAFRHEALGALEALAGNLSPLPRMESLRDLSLPGLRPFLESEGRIVLGARNWEGRRQVLMAASGMYRMALSEPSGRDRLSALYSGLLRWMSRRSPPERIQILPPSETRRSGRALEIRAGIFDPDFRRLERGRLAWVLRHEGELIGSGTFDAPAREGDDFTARMPVLPAGDYDLFLEASLPDGESLERNMDFPILPDAGEFARTEAAPAPLRWLAERSGGHFLESAELGALREALPRETISSTRQIRLRIWDHPLFFLLFLGLLATEWGLRKRHGLV